MCCIYGSQSQKSHRGLSRTDFIIVLCVTGTVIGLLMVALGRQRREHIGWINRNNLRQMSLAIHSYQGVYQQLPPAFDKWPPRGSARDHDPLDFAVAIHVQLLPFVEQGELYRSCKQQGKAVDNAMVNVFLAHDEDKETGIQHFAANLRVFSDKGVNTAFDRPMPRLAAIEPGSAHLEKTFTDGRSNSIVFATKYGRCGDGGSRYAAAPNSPFAAFFGEIPATSAANPHGKDVTFQLVPLDHECLTNPLLAQSFKGVGIFIAIADGSTRAVSAAVSPFTWNSLLQPNDGNKLGDDW